MRNVLYGVKKFVIKIKVESFSNADLQEAA